MLRTRNAVLTSAVSALAVCLIAQSAAAQSTMMGSRGSLSSSVGFGGSGGSSMGMSSGMGGMGSSLGGMGSMGMGGMGMGSQMGLGQMGSSSQFGIATLPSQQGSFVGFGNQGRFVGNAQAGAQQLGGGNSFGGGRNNNQFGGRNNNQFGGRNNNQFGGGRGNNQGFGLDQNFGGQGNFGGANNRNQPTIRPIQKVAFSYPQPNPSLTTTTINTRFEKLSERTSFRGLNVEVVEDGKAVLRGTVASEDSRRLAERIVALEPGVRSVRNELVVEPTAANDE
jgi:hypothetical protein